MTLKITKGQRGKGKLIHLVVIDTPSGLSDECEGLDAQVVRQATAALVSRLMVPDTCSIVGLLGTGLSGSNYDEILTWVSSQTDLVGVADSELIAELERRFRRAVDRFPEP